MAKEVKRWLGKPPLHCDICNRAFTESDQHFFDAKTKQGLWGILCQQCWNLHGVGLGVGLGQKYLFTTLVQVSGGAAIDDGLVSLKGVTSMPELRRLCRDHEHYKRVVIEVSGRLQGPETSFIPAWRWLTAVAIAGTDAAVLKEINAWIRDMNADAKEG